MFETLMDFVDNDYAIHTMDRPIVANKELHDILKNELGKTFINLFYDE